MAEGPLCGITVVECASLVAGPFCARLLADYGATVIKVEPPGGDPMRDLGPSEAPSTAGVFRALNTNKLGVRADLETEDGRRLLRELASSADVLVEDLSPGRLEELIGDPWRGRSQLVVASITPFGQAGPRSGWKGGDLIACAVGGLAQVTGDPEREPLRPGGLQALHVAGMQAAAGALIALVHARRTGTGQRVDISEQEAVIGLLESTIGPHSLHGEVRGRMGTHHPAVHGVGLQRLRDQNWLFVGTLPSQKMWDAVKELMGQPAWAQEDRWNDPRLRREHADEIDELAAETFSRLDTDSIYPAMKASGVPVGVVRDMAGVLEASPQLVDRGFFGPPLHEADHDPHPGAPWRMSETPWSLRRSAPELGQDNEAVFVERLGHSNNELERWRQAGVI